MADMTQDEALRRAPSVIVDLRDEAGQRYDALGDSSLLAALNIIEALSTPAAPGEARELIQRLRSEAEYCLSCSAAADTLSALKSRVEALEAGLREIERLHHVEGKDASWRAAQMNAIARALLNDKDESDDGG